MSRRFRHRDQIAGNFRPISPQSGRTARVFSSLYAQAGDPFPASVEREVKFKCLLSSLSFFPFAVANFPFLFLPLASVCSRFSIMESYQRESSQFNFPGITSSPVFLSFPSWIHWEGESSRSIFGHNQAVHIFPKVSKFVQKSTLL